MFTSNLILFLNPLFYLAPICPRDYLNTVPTWHYAVDMFIIVRQIKYPFPHIDLNGYKLYPKEDTFRNFRKISFNILNNI